MQRIIGRELLCLTLPVLVLGGVAWWRSRVSAYGGLEAAPSDLRAGKPRLEISGVKDLELTPYDVARGYVWGKQVTLWQGGILNSGGLRQRDTSVNATSNAKVVYKRGGKWFTASDLAHQILANRGARIEARVLNWQHLGDFATRRTASIAVRLDGVPSDAQEVRVRGSWVIFNDFWSAGCPSIASGPGWRTYGSKSCVFTTSYPFDYLIKDSKTPCPSPNVSRVPTFKLADAKVLYQPNEYSPLIQFHPLKPQGSLAQMSSISVLSARIRDAHGKNVELYDNNGAGKKVTVLDYNQWIQMKHDMFSPSLPPEDWVGLFTEWTATPKRGWGSVAFPLTLEAEVSDGTCWPLKIKTKVPYSNSKLQDFGSS